VYCVNCGNAYEPSYKFCNYCGQPVPSSGSSQEEVDAFDQANVAAASSQMVAVAPALLPTEPPPLVEAKPMSAVEPPPYARFVSLTVGSTLLISVLVFNIAEAVVRKHWDNTGVTVMAVLGSGLLASSAGGAWRRVIAVEPEIDITLKRRHRRVLRNSVVISLLFFTSAALVGAAIGKSGEEAIQLAADLRRMNTVGDRISKARNGVEATIGSYVNMYKTIAPDVQDLESTLGRLKTELGMYDRKFPAQHEQTSKSIAGMETGLRRMALLRQQIEVAKQIETLDPSQQVAAWKTRMLPILADEDALSKSK
jgi:hypothetical protein